MRLPNLDWPPDLFADSAHEAEPIVVRTTPGTPASGFWKEMTESWIGNGFPVSLQRGMRRPLSEYHVF